MWTTSLSKKKNAGASTHKWLFTRLCARNCQLSSPLFSITEILYATIQPPRGRKRTDSLANSWVRQQTSGQDNRGRNWMFGFQGASLKVGGRLPSPLPFLLLPNGWNMNVVAGASAATLSHRNHCSLKPQMGQDRRKLDTMSFHTSSGSHDSLEWQRNFYLV